MAKLSENSYEFPQTTANGSEDVWDAKYRCQSEELQRLSEVSRKVDIDKGEIKGIVVRFPVADGYAHYLVVNDKPLTLQHIPFCDAWQVEPALIRGLRKQDIVKYETQARQLDKLFNRKIFV